VGSARDRDDRARDPTAWGISRAGRAATSGGVVVCVCAEM